MKKIILSLLTFASLNSYAIDPREGQYIYNLNQTSDRYNQTIKIDSMIKVVELPPTYKLDAKTFNNRNIMSFRLGYQEESYEAKQGFFIQSTTPSFDVTFYRKLWDDVNLDLDFQVSKNNAVFRQTLYYSLFDFWNVTLSPLVRVGQKIALSEQVDSGYFFFNGGLSLGYENSFMSFKIDAYSSPSSFEKTGFYSELLYKVYENAVGVYFAQDHHDPINIEYERQGQENTRFGLIMKF